MPRSNESKRSRGLSPPCTLILYHFTKSAGNQVTYVWPAPCKRKFYEHAFFANASESKIIVDDLRSRFLRASCRGGAILDHENGSAH